MTSAERVTRLHAYANKMVEYFGGNKRGGATEQVTSGSASVYAYTDLFYILIGSYTGNYSPVYMYVDKSVKL